MVELQLNAIDILIVILYVKSMYKPHFLKHKTSNNGIASVCVNMRLILKSWWKNL